MIGQHRQARRARRFWNWFAVQSGGVANTLEALMRGETEADDTLLVLNSRLHQVDASLSCDIARTLDGGCELRLAGPAAAVLDMIAAAPVLRGWRIVEDTPGCDPRRAPYRVAPRPTSDCLATPLTATYEAWA